MFGCGGANAKAADSSSNTADGFGARGRGGVGLNDSEPALELEPSFGLGARSRGPIGAAGELARFGRAAGLSSSSFKCREAGAVWGAANKFEGSRGGRPKRQRRRPRARERKKATELAGRPKLSGHCVRLCKSITLGHGSLAVRRPPAAWAPDAELAAS